MLKYKGKLNFDAPLSKEELEFLNDWQNKLVEIYKEYWNTTNKDDREIISQKINGYSGISFNDKQRWAIFFAMSPMIHFEEDGIVLKGQSKKGNMREALMAYHHFFLSEDAVLKECMNLSFLKPHNFSGIVEAYKKDKVTDYESNWCYIAENNQIYSVDAVNIKEYEQSPGKWPKVQKEDTFYDKLVRYFPPLMEYAKLKKSINEKNIDTPKVEQKQKKIKI